MRQFKYIVVMLLALGLLAGAASTVAAQEGQPPRQGRGPHEIAGEVTAVGSDSLTITAVTRDEETVEIVVNVSDETVVFLMESQSEGSLSDIAVGDHVKVHGRPNEEGVVDAVRIDVAPAGDVLDGRVTAVDGQTISVENRDGEAATIVTGDDTTFWVRPGEEGRIADVTEGKFVRAFGTLQDDGSLSATVVFVEGRPPHGPGGPGGPGPGPRAAGDFAPEPADQ